MEGIDEDLGLVLVLATLSLILAVQMSRPWKLLPIENTFTIAG